MRWSKLVVATALLLAVSECVMAQADSALAYETVLPSRIRMGESAIIRVTSFGQLKSITIPTVPGLVFEELGRSQGLEFVNGTAIPATFIQVRVTPQFAGVFSIPGLIPNSSTLGLQVINPDAPDPFAWRSQKPAPLPVAPAPVPKGVQLQAGGAAYVHLAMPTRPIYVGESVPVEIEVGLRPGIVTSVNGLPSLTGSDFTLNNLSKQPERREQVIEGSTFVVLTWRSAIAAVKSGDFSLSAQSPLSVKINTLSAPDRAVASRMAWPLLQSLYNGIAPRDVTVASPSTELKVLPLPTEGQPKDFSGAVGEFQLSSDISPVSVAAGDPLTLRLHISGVGNFDRVDAAMLDHLDRWKTYPAKSSFTPSDAVGYEGEKVFEQPLIAAQPGEQSIPGLEFSYFSPKTQHYERAHTPPIKVTVTASLAGSSLNAPGGTQSLVQGLRADHPQPQDSVSELRPLYFRATFLAVPATVAFLLAASWFAVRSSVGRATSKEAERVFAQLDAVARTGDSSSFFGLARQALLQTFAVRWQMSAGDITSAELQARLGTASADIERLFALADEAKYSDYNSSNTDFQRWLALIRGQLAGERV
jgi:hypothetical protein